MAHSLREQHAVVTRSAILEAARRLFGERGFAATPVRLIADEAGVAVQTIYSAFGSKVGLAEALNTHLDAEAGVPELVARIRGSHDPVEVLRLLAQMQRQLWERCSDIVKIGRHSSISGDGGRALWEKGRTAHISGIAGIARHLDSLSSLRPGLSAERAGIELAALASVDAYETFVEVGGRSYDELEEWLADVFALVLDPAVRPQPAGRRPKGRR